MNILLRCGVVTVLVATAGWASDEKETDAQRYGLAGTVRTVSTQEGKAEFALDQTDWPVQVGTVDCRECASPIRATSVLRMSRLESTF